MTLLLTLLILAVIGLVAAVAVGRIGGGLDEPASSLPGRGLPVGRVGVADLEQVRFSPALRGYRMDEVDDVLDRLAEELQLREEEIADLRRALARPGTDAGMNGGSWRHEPAVNDEHDGQNGHNEHDDLDEAAFLPPTAARDEHGPGR